MQAEALSGAAQLQITVKRDEIARYGLNVADVRDLIETAVGGHVRVSAGNGGADVWIEIRDEGVGLEAEQQQRVFERFWRADGARSIRTGGAGLGLAICQEIARAHGGQIKVTSAPGLGSAFRLCLPARLD